MAGYEIDASILPGLNALSQGLQQRQQRTNQNALAQALSGGDSAGIQNALAQLSPTAAVQYRMNTDAATRASAKDQRDQLELKRGRFYDDLAGTIASTATMPADQQEAAWNAAHARLKSAYPEFDDGQGDDNWATAKSHAPALAAMDKKYTDVFGRVGLLPAEMGKESQAPWWYGDPAKTAAQRDMVLAGANFRNENLPPISVSPNTTLLDPNTHQPIYRAPPETPKEKALPVSVVNSLSGNADTLTNLRGLSGGFQDSYAGHTMTGGLSAAAGRLGIPGGDKDAAEWWQQYDRHKNEVRNKLFGASLTPSEKSEFEKADINPGMDPGVIRKNLAKQDALIDRGLQRQAKVWKTQGYNPDAIDAATGVVGAAPPITAPEGAAPLPNPTVTVREGATATNPKTGQKAVFRGGQWVPL